MIQFITDKFALFRDDVFPSFGGGNKARKMIGLHDEITKNNYNAIVTTGGIQSNHCRVVALYCKKNNIKCTLILHGGEDNFHNQSGNAKIIRSTKAKIIFSSPHDISKNMDNEIDRYKKEGYNPFYLQGGGHTIQGGKVYINLIEELVNIDFIPDYIFLASGSGTTQAGILAGISKFDLATKVIGISVGRKKKILEKDIEAFYHELCKEFDISVNDYKFIVEDKFLCFGYEKFNDEIQEITNNSLMNYGVILDTTYTGKAFYGMEKIIKEKSLQNKKILFWYTGGIYNYLT